MYMAIRLLGLSILSRANLNCHQLTTYSRRPCIWTGLHVGYIYTSSAYIYIICIHMHISTHLQFSNEVRSSNASQSTRKSLTSMKIKTYRCNVAVGDQMYLRMQDLNCSHLIEFSQTNQICFTRVSLHKRMILRFFIFIFYFLFFYYFFSNRFKRVKWATR